MATGTASGRGTTPPGPRTPRCEPRWERRRTTNARPTPCLRCGSSIEARQIGCGTPPISGSRTGPSSRTSRRSPPTFRSGTTSSSLATAGPRRHWSLPRCAPMPSMPGCGVGPCSFTRRGAARAGASATSTTSPGSRSGRARWGHAHSSSTRCTRWRRCIRSNRVRTTRPVACGGTRSTSPSSSCREPRLSGTISPSSRTWAEPSTARASSTAMRSSG